MKQHELLLTVVAEELGEVAVEALAAQKIVSKALRFGLTHLAHNEELRTRAQNLRDEFLDVMICVRRLSELDLIAPITEKDVDAWYAAKQERIVRKMQESKDSGCLES